MERSLRDRAEQALRRAATSAFGPDRDRLLNLAAELLAQAEKAEGDRQERREG